MALCEWDHAQKISIEEEDEKQKPLRDKYLVANIWVLLGERDNDKNTINRRQQTQNIFWVLYTFLHNLI